MQPRQDTMGGTYNFQLHPTFWFGMALCDSQSAPAPNEAVPCVPNTDANVFTSTNPAAPNYIGKHPGGAVGAAHRCVLHVTRDACSARRMGIG